MKKLSLIIGLISVITIKAENYIITWNNNPVDDQVTMYKVWSWKNGSPVLLTSSVTNKTGVVDLKGKQTITVTAVNDGGESDHSTNLVFVAKPGSPNGLNNLK